MTRPRIPDRIETERLVLRPPRESDAEPVIEAIEESRAELTTWMAWAPYMRTDEDARRWTERVNDAWNDPGGEDFTIGMFLRESGRFLGGTGFHRANWTVPSIDIGYWMRSSETGQGYVRETVSALTRVGFGHLGMRRMVITCASTNDRSRRVAEAVGYQHEATLRNHDRMPSGDLRDTLVYSLIDTDEVVRTLLDEDVP